MTKEEHKKIRKLIYAALVNRTLVGNRSKRYCTSCNNPATHYLHTNSYFIERCRKCCIIDIIRNYWDEKTTYTSLTYDFTKK